MAKVLQELLFNSARDYPNKTAVTFKDQKITYQELDRECTTIAQNLLPLLTKENQNIGILIDKSPDALAAILGVLWTGCCYIPLDPLGPQERTSLIINDCTLEILISTSSKIDQIRNIQKNCPNLKHIILLDRKDSEIGKDLKFKGKSSDLAYTLYTSGSTGTPKGVMITQAAALSFVEWAAEYIQVKQDDCLSAHAPFHFDLSIFDIFVAIKAGASIHIVPHGLSVFPNSLADHHVIHS